MSDVDVAAALVSAIQNQTLAATTESLLASGAAVSERGRALLRAATEACRGIERDTRAASDALLERLHDAGIDCQRPAPGDGRAASQFHRFELRLSDGDPTRAVELAQEIGYRSPLPPAGASWQAYRRFHDGVVLTRYDGAGTRARLTWPLGKPARAWPGRLTPRLSDLRAVSLGERWWPIAAAIAGARRVAGLPAAGGGPEWGWNGTPPDLMLPLFEFAGLREDDVLMDLGSGDGRVAIEAARRIGARAIGVESDEALCQTAVAAATEAGVADRVDIRCGLAADAPIEEATVVFLFLPVSAVSELLPELVRRLPAGSRIVAHEQARAEFTPPPDRVAPLFGAAAVSVGYRWDVRGERG